MRVVFDTNIWVAAVSFRGVASKLKMLLQKEGATFVISQFILDEVEEVLSRKKFGWTKRHRQELLEYLEETCVLVRPKKIVRIVEKDSDDDNIVACAVCGKADVIVTGDSALLDVGEWRGIRIITMRKLLNEFAKK